MMLSSVFVDDLAFTWMLVGDLVASLFDWENIVSVGEGLCVSIIFSLGRSGDWRICVPLGSVS